MNPIIITFSKTKPYFNLLYRLAHDKPNSQNHISDKFDRHGHQDISEDEKLIFQSDSTIPIIHLLSPKTKDLYKNLLDNSGEEKNLCPKQEQNIQKDQGNIRIDTTKSIQHPFPLTPKLNSSEYSIVKELISPTQSEKIQFVDKNKRFENVQSVKKPKIAYFDVTKLKTSEGVQKEQLEQLQNENNSLKEQLDHYIRRCEELIKKFKEGEENKSKGITLAKKYDEQLRSLNKNYVLLQKKVTNLENEKKELGDYLKLLEADKKNLLEKNFKLSKKLKTEDINKTNSKIMGKGMEEMFEKFLLLKTELQISKECERSYKRMYTEQTQMVKYLNEKYEKDAREKDFLLTKNIELIERIGKLQQTIKSNQSKDGLTMNNEKSQENKTIQELQNVVQKLEIEKIQLLTKIDELSITNEETLHQNNENIPNRQNQENLKDSEMKMTFGSCNESQQALNEIRDSKFENIIENVDLSSSTYVTREDPEYQALCLSFDHTNDEGINSILMEFEEKLSKEDYQYLLNSIRNYIDSLKSSFKANEIINKYNRLLVQYFQALQKIKALENPNTIQLHKVEYDESSNDIASTSVSPSRLDRDSENLSSLNPFKYRPIKPISKLLSSVLGSPLSLKDSKKRPESLYFGEGSPEAKQFLTDDPEKEQNSKLFIEARDEFLNGTSSKNQILRKTQLFTKNFQSESPKIQMQYFDFKHSKKCDDLNIMDLFNFQSTPTQKLASRPRSTPKTAKSYRDIYAQRKKENSINQTYYTDRSFGKSFFVN